jgi:hypothetical protein
MASVQERPQPKWLPALSRHQYQVGNVLLGAAGVLIVATIFLGVQYGWDAGIEASACALLGIVLGCCGFWNKIREPGKVSDLDATRILVLIVGGFLGLAVSLVAVARAIKWISYFTGGIETWQGPDAWRIWLCIGLELIGLAIMFGSLQLARTEERSNPVLRRLLYGYNAVLAGMLLLALLVVVNIMTYIYVPAISDWTMSGQYSLSPKTKNFLETLEQPVKTYYLNAGGVPYDMRNFLDNCQAVTNKLTVEYVSLNVDRQRARELINRYQIVGEDGLLVVLGTPPDESHSFIKFDELFNRERDMNDVRGGGKLVFKGEDALISTIEYLRSGSSRVVVYFTQGNGELDIKDFTTTRPDKGAGLLVERLQKSNFEVKGIKFSPVEVKEPQENIVTGPRVPDDAAVVIILGPRQPYPQVALAALRDYLTPKDTKKKKGKLVVFMDVVAQAGKMVKTGLEALLAEFNVDVGDNRILTADRQSLKRAPDQSIKMVAEVPTYIQTTSNAALIERNPIAKAFSDKGFPMLDARTVKPLARGGPERGNYQAEVLLQVMNSTSWAEDNLAKEPEQLVYDYLNNRPKELAAKLAREPLSVAVVVTEGSPPDPNDPHGFMRGPAGPQKPRMVVFGDASFASNEVMENADTGIFSLISSSLAWLRERPGGYGIEAKKRDFYQLDPKTNVSRMINLPFALMACGVIGLGLGIWVVRRR